MIGRISLYTKLCILRLIVLLYKQFGLNIAAYLVKVEYKI